MRIAHITHFLGDSFQHLDLQMRALLRDLAIERIKLLDPFLAVCQAHIFKVLLVDIQLTLVFSNEVLIIAPALDRSRLHPQVMRHLPRLCPWVPSIQDHQLDRLLMRRVEVHKSSSNCGGSFPLSSAALSQASRKGLAWVRTKAIGSASVLEARIARPRNASTWVRLILTTWPYALASPNAQNPSWGKCRYHQKPRTPLPLPDPQCARGWDR